MPDKMAPLRTLLIVATLIASVTMVAAQSGRRGTVKSTTTSVPQPSAPNQPAPSPKKADRLQLLVGVQEPSPFDGIPYYLASTVVDACLGRLNEPVGVVASPGSRGMSRADAVKAAKAETERYVVWLEIRSDAADAGRQTSNGADDLYITYMILEPGSAKIKQSGRVQHGIYKVGNVGVSGPTSRRSPVYSDYAVKQSAREAADKILAAFEIRVDGPWPR